jgi:nicotinamidase-related amidase
MKKRHPATGFPRANVALLLIDVINPYDFPGGPRFAKAWLPTAKRIAALRDRVRRARLPIVYVILAGFAADICVFFTAADAHMREYEVIVPADCTASESARDMRQSLRAMVRLFHARTTRGTRLRLPR